LRNYPDGASISDIHHGTELSRPTVKLAVADLIERGLVVEASIGTSTTRGGRPARRYRIDPAVGVIGGAVIGLERVDVMIGDLHGNVLAESSVARDAGIGFRDQIIDALHDLRREQDMVSDPIRALTVGVIGIVGPGAQIRKNEG